MTVLNYKISSWPTVPSRHVRASADTVNILSKVSKCGSKQSGRKQSSPACVLPLLLLHSFSHCKLQVTGPNLFQVEDTRYGAEEPLVHLVMSGTQPVTGSDGSHPPVPVKLSEPEQQRVQQADAKLQDYMKQKQSKVRS